jgi:hypothetical protein
MPITLRSNGQGTMRLENKSLKNNHHNGSLAGVSSPASVESKVAC